MDWVKLRINHRRTNCLNSSSPIAVPVKDHRGLNPRHEGQKVVPRSPLLLGVRVPLGRSAVGHGNGHRVEGKRSHIPQMTPSSFFFFGTITRVPSFGWSVSFLGIATNAVLACTLRPPLTMPWQQSRGVGHGGERFQEFSVVGDARAAKRRAL